LRLSKTNGFQENKNKNMRRFLMLMLGMLLFCSQLLAQTRTVTGRVTDANGAPIAGASVLVHNTNVGTVTREDGTFSITVPANARVLHISAVGHTPRKSPSVIKVP
jgi:hypothetical protein